MTTQAELDETRRKELEERFKQIDDIDIDIVVSWNHQQNIESSEKLLAQLIKYHGASYVGL